MNNIRNRKVTKLEKLHYVKHRILVENIKNRMIYLVRIASIEKNKKKTLVKSPFLKKIKRKKMREASNGFLQMIMYTEALPHNWQV